MGHACHSSVVPQASGRRSIKNQMLSYLCRRAEADPKALEMALAEYEAAENMTDQLGALSAVALACPATAPGLADVQAGLACCLQPIYKGGQAAGKPCFCFSLSPCIFGLWFCLLGS